MNNEPSSLAEWTPEQLAMGRRWVQAWREAGPELERLRRDELRGLDPRRAIALLCGSAEDLIVMKAFAARAKDWLDVEGVLIRHGRQLDWPYIHRQLKPLVELKESPEILVELERRRKECES